MDYQNILQLKNNYTKRDINKQFSILSKKYHPDKNPNEKNKYKIIVEAYENLITNIKNNINSPNFL